MPYKKLQYIIVYSIVVACILFLFVGVKLIGNQELKELWNLGHFVLFLFITYPTFISNKLNQYSLAIRISLITIVTVIVASSVEFIQAFLNRNASIEDIYISICGSITSVFLFTQVKPIQRCLGSVLFALAGTIIFLYSVVLFIHSKIDYPIKLGISKPNEMSYVSGRATRQYNEETGEITVIFNTDVYSSIKFTNIMNDWSEFKQLNINLTNFENRPFRIRFSIHDKKHVNSGLDYQDRYSKRIHINPGQQNIIIKINDIKNGPLNREMDVNKIQQLQLFTKHADQLFKTTIHSITLE